MFLEKTKLKDDSSNDADWVRKLRIVLIATQKDYVLNAPLSVLNLERRLWMWRTSDIHVFDDYSIVQCAMLYGLESGLQRRFERHGAYKMFQKLKLVFQTHARVERYEASDSTLPTRWRRIAQPVSMCSDCLGSTIT